MLLFCLAVHKKIALFILLLLLLGVRAEAKVALDPSVIGVGARVFGMGRAFVAAPGGPDSVFLNPASLTELPQWGATSMFSKLIGETDYILLGGGRPYDFGTLGIGYISASIGGIQNAHRDPITGVITLDAGTISYYNNITYLTYANKIYKDLSAGANLKLYSQGFSGGGDTASGYDMDLGLTYKPFDYLTVGFLQRNFLPSSMGGKISWKSGTEESLATSSRLGLNYNLGDINVNLDYELYPTQSTRPGLLKMGAEWWLAPTFALRAGSDQDPLETNLTAGISFLFSGFQFDYAYHQFGSLSSTTTHAFSFTYGIFREKEEKKYINVMQPEDKTTLFEDMVTVEGLVLPEVAKLESNGKEVRLEGRGAFHYMQPLELGKNPILLSVYDAQEKKLEEKKLRVLRLSEFEDVSAGYWARVPISILAMEKVVSGYPDGSFRPEGNVTRAEICSMLMKIRSTVVSRPSPVKFKDVPKKHWAASYIAQAVSQGAVKGYPDKTFKPNGLISRAEGVAMIARFSKFAEPTVLEAPFPDVPGRFWAAKEILAARENGLLKYLEGKYFEPNQKLTRAEVAEILSRTEIIGYKASELLNFDRGY